MALPQNEETVQALKAILEPMVLGKQLPSIRCNCGCLNFGPANATEIAPAGFHPYEGQEVKWYLWTVRMTPVNHPEGEYSYSTGLSAFVPIEELDRLFEQYFPQNQS